LGLGETNGDAAHVARLRSIARSLVGLDIFNLNETLPEVRRVVAGGTNEAVRVMNGMVTTSNSSDRLFAPFEVASLDI